MRFALVSSGNPNNAIVFQQAASSEVVSSLRQGVFGLVAAAPGIERTAAGAGLANAESVQVLSARAVGDSRIANVQAQGSAFESEIWADLHLVQTSTNTEESISSVTVRLNSPAAFEDFASALEAGHREEGLRVERERSYYEALSRGLSAMILALGGLVTVILSLGAVLGAAITMYASVEQRVSEIAVLRALGFSQTQVLLAFVTGALAGTLIGVIGGAIPALRAARLDPVRALRA